MNLPCLIAAIVFGALGVTWAFALFLVLAVALGPK